MRRRPGPLPNLFPPHPYYPTIISSQRAIPLPKNPTSPGRNMVDQSGSARFQVLFESAMQAYEKKTGVKLAEHPLAIQLQCCDSVEGITILLQGRARAFNDFQGCDRIMKSINATVSILTPLSDALSLADAVGLVTLFPPAKAIHVGLGILLDAANGIISSCEVLADLLESIQHFVHRLKIYTEISPTPAMDEVLVKLIVELISTLALVTRKLKQRRSLKWVKNFFGVKDIKAARHRLVRLTQEEIATTAAQTLEVVHGHVKNMKKFTDDVKASTDSIRKVPHETTSDVNKLKHDKLLSDIRSWLSPPDPWKNYNIARESRHRETGAWFVNGDTFSGWKASGPSSLLWVHGKPGSGKSVFCSTIIEDVKAMSKSGRAALAIYYYDFREDHKKDLRGLLSSLLFQLCDQSNAYFNILCTFYSTHHNGTQSSLSPSDNDLLQCLMDLLSLPGQAPVYLIVDALDECPSTSALSSPRERVLSFLEDLLEAQLLNLRICVTSRPETDIKAILEPLSFRSVSLHKELGQNEDIKNYIESVVNTHRNMRNWSLELKQLVIEALTERADGMFRWAYCQLEYLAGCLPARIQQALDTLPATLDETYERTLQRINDTKWEFARRLLLCVAAASRPLRVEELAEVLAFDFEARPIPKFREDWRLNNPAEAVLSTCSTLLSLIGDGFSQVIQFSHFSVKEFLVSTRFAEKHDTISHRYHISMAPAHTLLAQACLGILLHLDENVTSDSLATFPLAKYAAKHWFEHARFEGLSQDAGEGVKLLFDQAKPHLSVWLWIFDPTLPSWMRDKPAERPLPPCGTPLHYATFCGLRNIVKFLVIENPKDVNSRSLLGDSTPLHLASREGHVEVIRFLVDHGADLTARDNDGRTPLHWASSEGHVEVVHLLVEYGADLAARDKRGVTPLFWACSQGHVEIVRLLVKHGAELAVRDNSQQTPLHSASSQGRVEVVQFLIKHGANLAAKDNTRWTPLHSASGVGHMKVVRVLVEHGANLAAQDNDGWTPLLLASQMGYVDVIRLLLEHGANLATQTEDGSTPLHRASFMGHLDAVRLLVEYGADLAAKDSYEWTPLHRAFSKDRVKIMQFLVEHGADLAAQDSDGLTPLHWASFKGFMEPAKLLVEHGADLATQDKRGRTPLHRASFGGHVELARLLVEHGADLLVQDKRGFTPLHLASFGGRMELAQLLVEHGADLATQDNDECTALHWASSQGHMELAQLFIKHGADLATQDKDGWTALHRASYQGHAKLARLLIEHGANLATQDNRGLTPLHQASSRDHVEVAQLLIQHGADMAAQDNEGGTPLHQASYSGHVEVARLLIEYGADTDAQDDEGWTPLHGASSIGHLKFTQLLVQHGADAATQDSEGWTPLHWASYGGCVEVVQLLIEHDADWTSQDTGGSTPLHWASYQGHMEVVRLLIGHGADVAAQDEKGWTPLQCASDEGHMEVMRLLIEHGADETTQPMPQIQQLALI